VFSNVGHKATLGNIRDFVCAIPHRLSSGVVPAGVPHNQCRGCCSNPLHGRVVVFTPLVAVWIPYMPELVMVVCVVNLKFSCVT